MNSPPTPRTPSTRTPAPRALLAQVAALGCAPRFTTKTSTQEPTPAPGEVPASALFIDQTIHVGGVARTFDLYVPPLQQEDLGSIPVVFVLHGNGGSAKQVLGRDNTTAPLGRWLSLAEEQKLIVVAPNGLVAANGSAGFADCRGDATTNPTGDDVALVDALLDHVVANFGVDPAQAFATGISNGGHMALRLAIERSERFRAVAPIAASMPAVSGCGEPEGAISVLFIHSTADPICPNEGGAVGEERAGRGTVLGTRESFALWQQHNGVTAPQRREDLPDINEGDGSTVERISAGVGFPSVAWLRVHGGGHNEPSIAERYSPFFMGIVGRQNHDIGTVDEAWTFFAVQR